MSANLWPLVDFAAAPLAPEERDAVIGDSLEAGDSAWKALAGILGLVARRQLLLWKSWRPWFALILLAAPACYLLLYVSISVTCTTERLLGLQYGQWAPTGHEGFAILFCHIFLLITWSWTSGFAVGSFSPRTLWSSVALCALMFFGNVTQFCLDAVTPPTSLLFLAPAIWGVVQGRRSSRLSLRTALLLAATMTALTTVAWINGALWLPNWLLLFPAWYLVAAALRPGITPIDSHKLPADLEAQ